MRRVFALLVFAATSTVAAQRPPTLDIALSAVPLVEGPSVTGTGLLSDAKTREHLRNGFPTRIHYKLELVRKTGVFDEPAGEAEWDVLVNYEPTTQTYNMVRRSNNDQVRYNYGAFNTLTSAENELAKPYKPGLHPTRDGRYYYYLTVEVQTLAESDLDATLQWLRGTTAPGKTNNPVTVIRSGIGTLFSRMLGGAKLTYKEASDVFVVNGGGDW